MLLSINILLLVLLPLLALCAEDYYKILGVSKSASDRELKKAYRSYAKKHHPDKNPNDPSAKQKFQEVADAYDALSNAETRKIYDQYGHEGLKQHKQSGGRGGGGGHDPFDLFSRFFGGGGHFGGGERRGPNMEVRVSLPLRDFYNGLETEIAVEKQMICEACGGSGSQDGQMETCGTCAGRGAVVQKIMLAPGIFQQAQSVCGACGGAGKVVRHPCNTCKGTRVVRQKETHTLSVERGMPKGARIQYENEADESPDYEAGDLFVQLVEQEARLGRADEEKTDGTFFRRKGKDLFWREVLSLREAWMGDWTRNVTHLDGHTVRLSRRSGEVVQPNMVEMIKGEGMPVWQGQQDESGDEFGSLHVEYVVVLPDQMDKGMEMEFRDVWDKWRRNKGVQLGQDSGRPKRHEEL